ncbi:ribose transport system substrate-binding protein [Paenibacillus algorifonticola]|uniref:Ribose transport system substrate-binding protein n=1 Tax=Paenibacillus algorifonticola TaxID=684063 RepID=A0A1I2A4T0_9BACL|nr:sugar ABC transporter substrate-binding protein [Paenibacillus algorifonticola]SFE38826.1 ribose transport system substrate-binding protein [Paenibacillus algorifonticola]
MKRLSAHMIAGIALLVLVFATSACSGNSSSPGAASSEPSGSSEGAGGAGKIAYFSAGASNAYLQKGLEAAESKAKELGFEIDTFDGRFDPLTQLNQIQNAVTTGKYKGFVVEPVDGNQLCKVLSKDVPAKGVAVAIINATLCGSPDWQEGTLTYVGGQEVNVYKEIVNKIFSDKPEGGTIAVIGGPATGGPYLSMKAAFDSELPNHPEWKLIGMHATTYTANEAFQVAQNILQANKNLDVIFSNYSGMTVGVVKAIDAAKRDDVAVYDFGGDKWAFDSVSSGKIKSTVVMLPVEEVQHAIQALYDSFNGKEVEKYIDLTKDPILPGTPFVYKDNMADFTAKGLPEY